MARATGLMIAVALLLSGQPAGTAVSWPTVIAFDSADHETVCPPPTADVACVAGYILELWPRDSVGNADTVRGVWAVPREEVTLTGLASPRYQIVARYCCWNRYKDGTFIDFRPVVPYVWTLRSYGPDLGVKSARSAPTPEAFILLPCAPVAACAVG